MKTLVQLFALALLVCFLVSCASQGSTVSGSQPVEVFVGQTGITETVVKELERATNSVVIHTRSFSDAPIANALIEARKRGVEIVVVLNRDPQSDRDSQAPELVKAGIPVFVDGWHAKSQSNILIIDEYKILGNAFFWNKTGKRPNLLVIVDPAAASKAAKNARVHRQHSDPYTAK